MLNPKETQSLIEVISDPSQTFEKFVINFQKTFTKAQHFRAGRTLCYMLDEDLLNKSQRIQTIYLIYEMFKKDKETTTPFYPMLLRLLEESNDFEHYHRSKAERKLLVDCLTLIPKIGNKVVSEWIASTEKDDINTTDVIDVSAYAKTHFNFMPKLSGFESESLNPIIKDECDVEYFNVKTIEKDKMLNLVVSEGVSEEINTSAFIPNFLRPIPEVEPELEETIVKDAIWLFPGVLPEPCWDYTLGNNTSRVKTLMKKSLNGPLKRSNVDLITTTFKNDPEAVLHYGIHAQHLSKLVIYNKELAIDFMYHMSPYSIVCTYFDDLSTSKVNLNSMELFSNIIQHNELPKEYILLYIKNCIESCKDDITNSYKARLVRLVCIVINFLIINKVIGKLMNFFIKDKIKIFIAYF